jgi:hypothetical protein
MCCLPSPSTSKNGTPRCCADVQNSIAVWPFHCGGFALAKGNELLYRLCRSMRLTARTEGFPRNWLPDMDLNHDKQIQSLLCYRYTIGQLRRLKM